MPRRCKSIASSTLRVSFALSLSFHSSAICSERRNFFLIHFLISWTELIGYKLFKFLKASLTFVPRNFVLLLFLRDNKKENFFDFFYYTNCANQLLMYCSYELRYVLRSSLFLERSYCCCLYITRRRKKLIGSKKSINAFSSCEILHLAWLPYSRDYKCRNRSLRKKSLPWRFPMFIRASTSWSFHAHTYIRVFIYIHVNWVNYEFRSRPNILKSWTFSWCRWASWCVDLRRYYMNASTCFY